MDLPVMSASLSSEPPTLGRMLARRRANEKLFRIAEIGAAVFLTAVVIASIVILNRDMEPGRLMSPTLIAILLVATLLPAILLLVLMSRRLARSTIARGELGRGGRLHTRLVALFSVIAAVPTVLVAIFASLLFQSGLEFWFSDRARGMLENTVAIARNTFNSEVERVTRETITMSSDLSTYLKQVPIDSPEFAEGFARQVYYRNLSEAAVVNVSPDGKVQTLALVNPYDRPFERIVTPEAIRTLKGKQSIALNSSDRVGSLAPLDFGKATYVYAARVFDPAVKTQIDRASDVLDDYHALLVRSRTNQLRFNGALLAGALLIVALAIFAALNIADRLVRPIGQIVTAARRVEAGDFTTRLPTERSDDELAALSVAFNRMTGRLQEQTGALVTANRQLEVRTAFIEAVLSSVTAGVIALDNNHKLLLINRSARALLAPGSEDLEGVELETLSPDLQEFLSGERRNANVLVRAETGQRTLAVTRVRSHDGYVLTFDDIKNPLTPIQLAAERLQRRYAKEITSDQDVFTRLTETIVRQVADLRRMVDEFSSFARMPKPAFREENIHEIARSALFLHEVAHPGISFSIQPEHADLRLICDRRQLGQAVTNVVKNAVEAIESRRSRGEAHPEGDRVDLKIAQSDEQLVIGIYDTGVGLPEDRDRLTEPYMTTRVRGTGLGLAIVKKIVEEHFGEISFFDRPGGGAHVRIAFDTAQLAALGSPSSDEEEPATPTDDGQEPA